VQNRFAAAFPMPAQPNAVGTSYAGGKA
jgi:hypothetical protein